MLLNSPIGLARMDRLIQEMSFDASHQVLDVGCGTGELLIRIAEAHGSSGLGVDRDEEKIAEAKATASRRLPTGSVEFRVEDAAALDLAAPRYHRAICLGSTHAFARGEEAYEGALDGLMRLVVPGG